MDRYPPAIIVKTPGKPNDLKAPLSVMPFSLTHTPISH